MENEFLEKYMSVKNKHIKYLTYFAVVVTSFLAIINGYTFVMNNIYIPKITIISVDFDNAISEIKIGSHHVATLSGNSTLLIRGDWGIRFGTNNASQGQTYDTIELVKNNMVFKTIATRS